jgi:trigger factor
VGKDDVRTQYDDLIRDYTKTLAIPGFRRGKVPRDVLERKFGAALKDEAVNKILGKTISEVFEDEGFPREDKPLPYSTPRVEDEPVLEFGRDLRFSVVYDVLPRITVGPWKGLEAEIPDVSVSEEDVSRELEEIRDRNAVVLDREDTAEAARDDVVTISYWELDGEGSPVKGTERQDFVFTLGSGYNLYQFDDNILGMKKGETRDITKTFPAGYTHSDLAGKTLTIRVTLTALKEKKLPVLDDELAQDVDEKYHTLEDLKNSIRDRLGAHLEKRLRDITVSRLLEQVLETTPMDLPESMIDLELDSRLRNLARRFNVAPGELARRLAEEEGAAESGPPGIPEKLREEWRGDAERALKSRLIVETLMRDLKLEASGEEIEREIENQAASSGTALEEIKKYYDQENAREYLEEEIKERKLFDLFIAENRIKKGKQERYLDLMSGNG